MNNLFAAEFYPLHSFLTRFVGILTILVILQYCTIWNTIILQFFNDLSIRQHGRTLASGPNDLNSGGNHRNFKKLDLSTHSSYVLERDVAKKCKRLLPWFKMDEYIKVVLRTCGSTFPHNVKKMPDAIMKNICTEALSVSEDLWRNKKITQFTENDQASITKANFVRYVKNVSRSFTYDCRNRTLLGNLVDGGWDVCQDRPFKLKQPCLVYSFGVGKDWSFENDLIHRGCIVHSFDPTIGCKSFKRHPLNYFHNVGLAGGTRIVTLPPYILNAQMTEKECHSKVLKKVPEGHGSFQKLLSSSTFSKEALEKNQALFAPLAGILAKLGHTKTPIDILKIDVEGWEWEIMANILFGFNFDQNPNVIGRKSKNSNNRKSIPWLKNVKQLVVEIHLGNMEHIFSQALVAKLFSKLDGIGMKLFASCGNIFSSLYPQEHFDCYEFSFVNVKFDKV